MGWGKVGSAGDLDGLDVTLVLGAGTAVGWKGKGGSGDVCAGTAVSREGKGDFADGRAGDLDGTSVLCAGKAMG